MIKKILQCSFRLILLVLFVTPFAVSSIMDVNAANARTIKELRQELADLEAQKKAAENKKALTQSQIRDKKNAITTSEQNIVSANNRITKAEGDIKQSEKDIAATKEETENLLRFLQMSDGENALLEYIANADSTNDLIIRAAVVEQLTQHNEEKLQELEDLIKKNQQLKADLAKQNETLKSNIQIYAKAAEELEDELVKVSDTYADIDTRIKSQKADIAYYKKICSSETQDINTCSQGIANTSGFLRPMQKGRISSGWGRRSGGFHYGTDSAGVSEGTSVYAAAAGRVSDVWYRSKCGGNVVFINHIVNGVAYTTEYAHLLNINVSKGQNVTTSTRVGGMGGGSTSSYDQCTFGAHLHFNVSKGHYYGTGSAAYRSWSTYLSKSFKPTFFPGVGSWYYTR